MVKFERSLTIDVPVEKIFDYLSDRTHLPLVWPSLLDIKQVKKLPTGGYTFAYVYKMANMRFEGTGEDTEFLPKQRIVTKLVGDIEGTITFTFEPVGTHTKVFFAVAYTVPPVLLGKFPEPIVLKLNELEAEFVLANLKTWTEAGLTVPAGR